MLSHKYGLFRDRLVDVHEIQKRIERCHDALYYTDPDGTVVPLVCTFCDHFIMGEDDSKHILCEFVKTESVRSNFTWDNVTQTSKRIKSLVDYYRFKGNTDCLHGDKRWLTEIKN
jgi:hypothetical protein